MAVSPALRRLLRIRELNEEQHRLALEAALNELNRLEQALATTAKRDTRGLRLIASSARSGELADRLAGLEETRVAARHAASLAPRIADSRDDIDGLREQLLAVRVERRQAETLVDEAQPRGAASRRLTTGSGRAGTARNMRRSHPIRTHRAVRPKPANFETRSIG
jgi:hypothetical protein